MKTQFFAISSLLSNTTQLLTAGYFIFGLQIITILAKSTFNSSMTIIFFLFAVFIGLHHYLSIRVKFDADLLSYLSTQMEHTPIDELTKQLDGSLVALKLMPLSKSNRDWQLRFKGCLTLFKIQIVIFTFQIIALVGVLMIQTS